MLKRISLALVLSFVVVLSAMAQDFQKGWAASERGDHVIALKEWRPLAEQGHALAQYNVAQMYFHGNGVPQDYAEAEKWFRKAARQGLAQAQNYLGNMHERGRGVPQDYAEALKWYRKAAEQGDGLAQTYLGNIYVNGFGVARDLVLAFMWMSLAANNGGKNGAKFRDLLAKFMTAPQLAKSKKMVLEWQANHPKKK
ncbi:MAG: sel1 repeat family protein [Proteobacteria bacterium]|nr:sel1 repeat family protein [Pseudomonadota bacterium]